VAAGREGAVSECIDRFGGLVWRLTNQLLPARADREDAVQEVFVEVWRSAARYDPSIASEAAFVAVIARRRLIDRARRERTRIAITINSGDSDATPASTGTLGLAKIGGSERDDLARCEESALASAAIARLSREQQDVLRFSFHNGMSHQDIASRMNIPLGTVKTNLRRGLIRIRESMKAGAVARTPGSGIETGAESVFARGVGQERV